MKIMLFVFLLAGCSLRGYDVNAQGTTHRDVKRAYKKGLNKFEFFYKNLDRLYMDDLDYDKLIEAAIKGMLEQLDPHSFYFSPDQAFMFDRSHGYRRLAGGGGTMAMVRDTLFVLDVVKGTPYHLAGLRLNDRVLAIGGQSTVGVDMGRVNSLITLEKGFKQVYDVLHEGESEPVELIVAYDVLAAKSLDAAYKTPDNIAYIRISHFAKTTEREFSDALASMDDVAGIIIDLRDNNGGDSRAVEALSGRFLGKGASLGSNEGVDRIGRKKYIKTNINKNTGKAIEQPLAVLVDYGSASASEVFAGIVQDWDRGVIVGQGTFGKGISLRYINYNDGSAIGIAFSRIHTPSGRSLQRNFEPGDRAAYRQDHKRRATDRQYVDSLLQSAPEYKTLVSGRTIKGDNGVQPDVFVEADTVRMSSRFRAVYESLLMEEVANSFVNTNRELFEGEYADFVAYLENFETPGGLLEELGRKFAQSGQKIDPAILDVYRSVLLTRLKAMIAGKIWSTSEYYRVMNVEDDREFDIACSLLKNQTDYMEILGKQPE